MTNERGDRRMQGGRKRTRVHLDTNENLLLYLIIILLMSKHVVELYAKYMVTKKENEGR